LVIVKLPNKAQGSYAASFLISTDGVFLQRTSWAPSFDDGGGGDQGQLGFPLQVWMVTDPQLHMVGGPSESETDVVPSGAGIGNVGIDALLEDSFPGAAQVVPCSCGPCRPTPPVFS
jgi:hypothetical protein